MLTTAELLRRLEERGVRNAQVAKALNVPPSRVTEMKKGARAIKLDEAARLVEAFGLEQEPVQRVSPLPAQVSRLIVQHIALQLGRDLPEGDPLLLDLAEDLRAFAEFVTDPAVRESIDLATVFFQSMRLRRPAPVEAS